MAKAHFPLKKRIRLVEQCFEFISTGQSVGKFADSIGIPRTTLYGWLKRYSPMVNRKNKAMVPITCHSSSSEVSVGDYPKSIRLPDNNRLCIDLGYCRIEIPQGCSSDIITTLLKGIRDAQ
ncbi:MAG: hypothetical protein JJE17_06825 [Peptostreptococcaceae bacterium]|nr:hypothetical protein [Peptostreptococcaceae bacterium]